MPLFGFPFDWGSAPDAVSVSTTTTVSTSTARWTNLSYTAKAWIEGASTPHRFERIYDRPHTAFGQSVNFNYEIRSQFPFIISSSAQVVITSTITTP